jgi:hypothetical protein
MRQDFGKLLHEISLRIVNIPQSEVRWDVFTLCDYAQQFLDLKYCSPSSRPRLWKSLIEAGFPIEAQLRLEKYNGTFLRDDIAWLLNFLDAIDEAACHARGSKFPLPVAYDFSTREFVFEWISESETEIIVKAAYDQKSPDPGVLENWLKENSKNTRGGKALFAECLWIELPDWQQKAHILLKDFISSERYEELAAGDELRPNEIELFRSKLASSVAYTENALLVGVWQLETSDGRKAYITTFHDRSGRLVEIGGPFLSFPEIEQELQNQGVIERWKFF